MAKSVTIFQVYHPLEAGNTDTYFATESEAEKRRADLFIEFAGEPAHLRRREVELTRSGICNALEVFPCRSKEDAIP